MSVRNSFSDFFRDLGNGVGKAIDIAIGSERSGFTDSLNGAIGDMENSFNNIGAPPPYYNNNQGYGQQPFIGQQGYYNGQPQPGVQGGNYYGQQQYGYPNGMNYGQPNPNVYVNNGSAPNVQYGGRGAGGNYGGGAGGNYSGYGSYGNYGYNNQYNNRQPPPQPQPQPQQQYGEQQYANTKKKASVRIPPEALLNDGSPVTGYITATDRRSGKGTSFELPDDFVEMNGGKGAEMLYMYKADEGDFHAPRLIKPYICIIPAGGGLPLEKDCTAACIGLMEIRSKGWVNYRGKACRYYGFTRRDDSRQLLALFCEPNVVGNKMIDVLDHAAETYRDG